MRGHRKAPDRVSVLPAGVEALCHQSSPPARGLGLGSGQAASQQEGPEARSEPAHLPELSVGGWGPRWGGSLSSVSGGEVPGRVGP